MASKFKFWSVAVVGMGLAAGGAWWLQAQPMSAKEITPASGKLAKGVTPPRVAGVEVAQVVAMPLRDDAQAVGSLRARQSVMLRPELVGRITALHFKDGGTVRKGQVLVQFDDLLQQADVQQMQAQLAIAQANY
ncbi:MAG: biotin/lipoyl-binding protein, partial [Rhodoferax sp.]|nr:biotin/lipoyl-binding protein [Rhodoferax sp.]